MKTVVGYWSNAQNGRLLLELSKYALVGATRDNAPRYYSIALDDNGMIPEGYRIWCNDEIMPEGTTYKQIIFDSFGYIVHGPEEVRICGPAPVTLTPDATGQPPPPPVIPVPPTPPTPPTQVVITPGSATLQPGGTQQFTANMTVTWSVDVGTIDASGLYTAPSVTTATIATITATGPEGQTTQVQISIQPIQQISVSISPTSGTLSANQTLKFAAIVNNSINQNVTWGASLGSIDTTGLYTAPINIPLATTATITAVSVADPTKSNKVSVSLQVSNAVPVVLVNPPGTTIQEGQTQQFTATVTNLANQAVTWSIDTGGIGTISTTGLYTAPAVVLTQTTVNITVRSVGYPASAGAASVTIAAGAVPVVLVNPQGATVNPGGTQQFTATITNLSDQSVTWSLQPGTPGVAVVGTISATGLYTAPASLAVTSYDKIVATSVAYPSASNPALVTVNAGSTQLDLVQWMVLSTRSTQHLAGDPSAPYSVQVLDTDSIYPSNYPKGCVWQIKNKLGNPWDVHTYNATAITHWITENGDSVDQAACQAANGTSCWMYARAYKRYLTPVKVMPRYFTPGSTITIDNPSPNDVNATTDCETSAPRVVHIGAVRGITTGPFKISWGGSIDHGTGTLASGPNYDSVNGVDTIRNQYCYTVNSSQPTGFADVEEYYFVLGWGEVAWYYYHNGTFVQKTVNTTLASGGAPVPNFPCGPGKSWFV